MSIDIKEVLFWIFLILGLILLIWYILGDSPTEFAVIITLIFTVLLKVWAISDRQIVSEMKFKALAKDFKEHITHI